MFDPYDHLKTSGRQIKEKTLDINLKVKDRDVIKQKLINISVHGIVSLFFFKNTHAQLYTANKSI